MVGLQFFGGHPETNYCVGVVAVAFAFLRWSDSVARGAPVPAPALALAGGAALGTALAAVAMAVRRAAAALVGPRPALLAGDRIDAEYLLGLALPTYWGRPTQTDLLTPTLMLNHAFYAGSLPLMLALGALLRPSPRRVAVAALAVWSLATVVGLDPFFSITQALPGLCALDRLQFLVLFAIALLAGRGLDDLMAARPAGAWVLIGLGGALLCLPLAYGRRGRSASTSSGRADAGLAVRGPGGGAGRRDPGRRDPPRRAARVAPGRRGGGRSDRAADTPADAPAFAALADARTAFDLFKLGTGVNPAITNAQANQPNHRRHRLPRAAAPARFVGTASSGSPR